MRSGRILIILFGFTLLFLIVAGATCLDRHGIWHPFSSAMAVEDIRPEWGFAYVGMTHHGELSGRTRPSAGRMLENGVPLPGPADSIHEDIRELGKGRFSFWDDNVYFSSTDNSVPGANGRRYEFRFPVAIDASMADEIYSVALGLLAVSILIATWSSEMRRRSKCALDFIVGSLIRPFHSLGRFAERLQSGQRWLAKRGRPLRYAEPLLAMALLTTIASVFFFFAKSDNDWELLVAKHYWSATAWYYGGYGWDMIKTPQGYRTLPKEGLPNYANLYPLRETESPAKARSRVEGFPGPERLGVSFLLYTLLHLKGPMASNIWSDFWVMQVALWLATIYLTHRVAAQFFDDPYTPWLSAILVAMYPSLTLTFNSLKLQPVGTTYLLLGILLFERQLKAAKALAKLIGLTALVFLGMFVNGAWFYVAAFIFFRAWWQRGRDRWLSLGGVILAVGASKWWFGLLAKAYHLPLVEEQWHFTFRQMFADSGRWLSAWWAQEDVRQLRFANYYGIDFFHKILPLIWHGFFAIHAPLLLLVLLGVWFEARIRMFALLILPMLAVGHSGMIMVAWEYHYGYLSFPAGMMAIFGAAGTLSWLLTRRRVLPRILAVVILFYVGLGFTNVKRQVGLYYDQGHPETYQRRVFIYYGGEASHGSF